MNIKDKIDLSEAVKYTGKSEVTIRHWLSERLIINYVPGSKGRAMRFDKTELDAVAIAIRNPDAVVLLRQEVQKKIDRLRSQGHLKSPHELIAA